MGGPWASRSVYCPAVRLPPPPPPGPTRTHPGCGAAGAGPDPRGGYPGQRFGPVAWCSGRHLPAVGVRQVGRHRVRGQPAGEPVVRVHPPDTVAHARRADGRRRPRLPRTGPWNDGGPGRHRGVAPVLCRPSVGRLARDRHGGFRAGGRDEHECQLPAGPAVLPL